MYRYGDKLAFIAHPRTASRSTRNALYKVGVEKCNGHHPEVDSICNEVKSEGGIVACTVRNPFDLLVSWYFNQHYNAKGILYNADKTPEFEPWLWDVIRYQTRIKWLKEGIYFYGLRHSNRILRFETLQEDVSSLLRECGLNDVSLVPFGVSVGRKDYKRYFSPELRSAVEKRWAQDFQATGYTW